MPVSLKDSWINRSYKIDSFPYENILDEVSKHAQLALNFIESIEKGKMKYSYEKGKWTVADVIGHLIDHQVLFLYRVLCFSRKDPNPLPGAEENHWAAMANYSKINGDTLVSVYKGSTQNFQRMMTVIPSSSLGNTGVANGVEMSLKELLAFFILHEKHHIRVLKERYGC